MNLCGCCTVRKLPRHQNKRDPAQCCTPDHGHRIGGIGNGPKAGFEQGAKVTLTAGNQLQMARIRLSMSVDDLAERAALPCDVIESTESTGPGLLRIDHDMADAMMIEVALFGASISFMMSLKGSVGVRLGNRRAQQIIRRSGAEMIASPELRMKGKRKGPRGRSTPLPKGEHLSTGWACWRPDPRGPSGF